MAKQYRVDTSEGMAEYIKSMNDEQLAKDTYYQNWQKWLNTPAKGLRGTSRPSRGDIIPVAPGPTRVNKPFRDNITPVAPGSTQVSRPSTTGTEKYKDAVTMYQNREDFYKNLTTSATESVDTINKYWDATNLALKQKAGYDISQAYKNYLEQETALKESGLAAGSKAYVGGELSEAYKETKTDVDTSLAANLESAEAKRTEQLETVKTGVDKAIEEYDALFEGSKYNIENGKKLTDIANNINIGLATFADSTDIKKNLDSLQAEYDKKDAIATRLEATDNTEAAKAARAEANAIKKIIDTANNKLQTYAYDKQKMTQKMLDKYFKSDEFNEFVEMYLINQGADLDSMTSEEKTNAINSIKSEFVTTLSEGEGAGARVLTDFGKEQLARWYKDDKSTGLLGRMDELGLNDAAVTNLLGLDKNKNYFGGSEKTYQEYSANQSEKILKDIKNTKYVGTVQTSNDDSYTVDGKTYSKKGKDVSSDRLDISKEDYDKIPNGTVFEAKVDDDIKYPEYLINDELSIYGFKDNNGQLTLSFDNKSVDERVIIIKDLISKGYTLASTWGQINKDNIDEKIKYYVKKYPKATSHITIIKYANNTKKFYKDIDGKLYKMF